MVFYTGRVTPARETRAAALGALGVTTGHGQLMDLVGIAARQSGSREGQGQYR
ncbi:hypothetical protein GXW82_13525 [Streptacidiphilus sp. 4-A2]|nr:hypothetical protein [Streptacidiphilus sp. 4-A2]